MTARYERLSIALKYYLVGKGYTTASRALAFGKTFHTGLRKDGITPEFQHQVEIALYITTLKSLRDEEKIITVGLLHDVMEDHDVDFATIEREFGNEIAESVWAITKKHKGMKKSDQQYYLECASDVHASVAKGSDRIHNVNSMIGVFSKEKQAAYIKEVEEVFLPMLKKAEGLFPDQLPAYLNIRHMLKSQVALVRAGLEGEANEQQV
jgi:(p)ppGpp synthase/HD superfamily hydrolase